jgi:hypothetical protein
MGGHGRHTRMITIQSEDVERGPRDVIIVEMMNIIPHQDDDSPLIILDHDPLMQTISICQSLSQLFFVTLFLLDGLSPSLLFQRHRTTM